MKTFAIALFVGVACVCATYLFVARSHHVRHATELADRQAAWDSEKAELENALANAQQKPQTALRSQPRATSEPIPAAAPAKPSPQQIIANLRAFKTIKPGETYALRRMLHDLEELVMAGPAGLPAIKDFLNGGDNAFFSLSPEQQKGARNLVPQTLRLALLEAAKRIGGTEAESLLADTLARTGRSEEVTWLAFSLQEIAPDKYRDLALDAARRLLSAPASPDGKGGDRDLGFMLLSEFRDTSYVAAAQQQLVRADGKVDKSALKYLMQTLGPQSVPVVAQMYEDPRITDPNSKEPFARLALNFVGADQTANDFYVKAINDSGLSNEARKNLIEDLNQDGFANRKNLTANDLPLINSRMALIEQLVPSTTDQVNLAAMKEAYKDLVKMRERITNPQQSVK
jgi:hypothetical protein